MPIFEYQCKACKHTFERIVFRAVNHIECPNCGHTETERLISSFAVSGDSRRSASAGNCGPGSMG